MGMLALGERQRVRLFARRDPLDRFVSCLVFVPRDRFNTENREKVGAILKESFGGDEVDWSLLLAHVLNSRARFGSSPCSIHGAIRSNVAPSSPSTST